MNVSRSLVQHLLRSLLEDELSQLHEPIEQLLHNLSTWRTWPPSKESPKLLDRKGERLDVIRLHHHHDGNSIQTPSVNARAN